ncbi:MAG TPA: YraN family protein [Bacillota bacterium]|nr:YraN family protein [Bacillota bacterium]
MTPNRKELGGRGETLAADYLRHIGWEILRMNYLSKGGEVDIIARRNGQLLFVEVKYRTDLSLGHPAESITRDKLRRIRRAAVAYLQSDACVPHSAIKFDAICIVEIPGVDLTLEHIEDILGP